MKIDVRYIESTSDIVVRQLTSIDNVIDTLREIDDASFNKAVTAAKWLRVFDKGLRWIEGKFYAKRK